MFVGLGIVLRSYERRSLFTFMALYLGGILLMSAFVFWWYAHKETRRIGHEQQIALKLYDLQCKRVLKNAPKDFECPIQKPEFNDFNVLYQELTIAGVLILFLSTLFSFLLALISLRPMRNAINLIDNFTKSMIHDLNTPITTAKLNVTALLKEDLNTNQNRRLNRILQSLQMIQTLENRLKNTLITAKVEYHDQKLSLSKLCEHFKERSSLIRLQCDKNIFIKADEVMIVRLIDNLISNAIKYNKNNHPIDIKLFENRVSITDQGCGIAHPNRIFDPYYRENSTMSGLGLGLGIVKEICNHYKIKIDVKSKTNYGTTITLDFSSINAH